MPNDKSAVLIDDFKSPRELAEFLLNLNENDNEYDAYLRHKSHIELPVTNHKLLNDLATRPYRTKTLIQDFECFVCANHFGQKSTRGFECGEKLIYPQMEEKRVTELDWQSMVKQGKCEAETLEYFLSKNVPYTDSEYTNALFRRYDHGLCEI